MLKLKGIDHVVLRVRDIDAMRRFYCDVLGATHVAWRPQFRMSHLRVGAALIDLVEGDPGHGRNMDHLCLQVGDPFDPDVIVAHLKKHNVAVGEIRNRFGTEGNGVSIYVSDPEGNTIELKGPSDGRQSPT